MSQDTRAIEERPALRRNARHKDKGRPNYSYTPDIEPPETPATSSTTTRRMIAMADIIILKLEKERDDRVKIINRYA